MRLTYIRATDNEVLQVNFIHISLFTDAHCKFYNFFYSEKFFDKNLV